MKWNFSVADIEDEASDVFDPTDDEPQPSNVFSITSYGADYPVEIIPKRIKTSDWYAPTFQRNFVWSQNQSSRFIESLLLGLPVPGIFLFKESDTGKHLIIDGQQRTKTIQLFLDEEDFGDRRFRLTNVAAPFIGKSFSELEDADRRRLEESIIHATIFQQKSPEEDISSVYEVFERINTGGSKLSAQEIRSCVNHGPIVQFLEELASTDAWLRVFRSRSKRLKDHELILRFFAFRAGVKNYSSPMKKFLDKYMRSVRSPSKQEQKKMKTVFEQTLEFIVSEIGDKTFRPERAFNAAVFDCVAVQTSFLIEGVQKPKKFSSRYAALLADEEFLALTSRSTADDERVQARFRKASKILA
ncbi:MAG: DUF262 domain-containing protein [Parvularculaceae bacterium]